MYEILTKAHLLKLKLTRYKSVSSFCRQVCLNWTPSCAWCNPGKRHRKACRIKFGISSVHVCQADLAFGWLHAHVWSRQSDYIRRVLLHNTPNSSICSNHWFRQRKTVTITCWLQSGILLRQEITWAFCCWKSWSDRRRWRIPLIHNPPVRAHVYTRTMLHVAGEDARCPRSWFRSDFGQI